MYNAIELSMLADSGKNIWMPIATAANVAQGAAALAVAFKTKQQKLKSMALPASLSAFLGITEPAIFGVNLRFMKPLIAGMIGGACGAAVASVMNVYATANGVTGVFGFLIMKSIILFALKSMGWPWHHQMPAALKHGGDVVTAARRGFLRQSGGDAE